MNSIPGGLGPIGGGWCTTKVQLAPAADVTAIEPEEEGRKMPPGAGPLDDRLFSNLPVVDWKRVYGKGTL